MKIESKKLLKINSISHGFFSNRGGISKGIYKSLNCGLGSKDNRRHILYNLEIVKKKFKVKKLNLLKQIHSNKVLHLKNNNSNLRLGEALLALGLAERLYGIQKEFKEDLSNALLRRETLLRLVDPVCLGDFKWFVFNKFKEKKMNINSSCFR